MILIKNNPECRFEYRDRPRDLHGTKADLYCTVHKCLEPNCPGRREIVPDNYFNKEKSHDSNPEGVAQGTKV